MRRTFLVILAHPSEREAAAAQLERALPGAEVLAADSAEAAFALLEERRLSPSLIFTGLDLPGMSGLEFLGQLRHRRWLERAPVAVASQSASDRQVIDAYRLGACTFLTLPLRAYELREAVRDFGVEATQLQVAAVVAGLAVGPRATAA